MRDKLLRERLRVGTRTATAHDFEVEALVITVPSSEAGERRIDLATERRTYSEAFPEKAEPR